VISTRAVRRGYLRGRPRPRFTGYTAVTRSVDYCTAITRSVIVVILGVLGVAVLALGRKYSLIAVDLKGVGLLLS
jgi:hypothetical protein